MFEQVGVAPALQAKKAVQCAGLNEHGNRCKKKLLVWVLPKTAPTQDSGRLEVMCPRCQTINYVRLADLI